MIKVELIFINMKFKVLNGIKKRSNVFIFPFLASNVFPTLRSARRWLNCTLDSFISFKLQRNKLNERIYYKIEIALLNHSICFTPTLKATEAKINNVVTEIKHERSESMMKSKNDIE